MTDVIYSFVAILFAGAIAEAVRRTAKLVVEARCIATLRLVAGGVTLLDLLIIKARVKEWKQYSFFWSSYLEYEKLEAKIDEMMQTSKIEHKAL